MSSGNIWKQLLEENSEQLDQSTTETYVVCCENEDSLNQFLQQCWQIDEGEKVTNLEPLGFFTKVVSRDEENLRLNVYYAKSPLDAQTLQFLGVFLRQMETSQIRWIFLLDWLLDDKRLWLRQLRNSWAALEEAQVAPFPGGAVVVVLNPSHVTQLERNTMVWNSRRLDLVHQTLRAACLNTGSALVTLDPNTAREDVMHICALLAGLPTSRPVAMLSLQSLFIPHGADSIGKICTIAPEFPVATVFDNDFVSSTFEAAIAPELTPGPRVPSDHPWLTEPTNPPSEATAWHFDLQGRLATLYRHLGDSNKAISVTQHRFHKPRSEDYAYEFELPSKHPTIRDLIRSAAADSPNDVADSIDGLMDGIVQRNVH
ncbi:AGL333Wp [Eremothecium gossypii ATCC 10895]|uniref:Cytoplasmic dynein intermediate light chain DYN3 n=1 Tax=Eremothecium gossypii (strain ATCC 10895 / CBS 109.51 / FGSC 9923 / NRRL Y-1056) TaxID=284811 RepID=DYN3_EREGS|nr:AGL333Wp [Eremothecium gossypii ATCC 10895]Q751N0.1 RecName: Full=Cytoplasmic dynein intermediate light chain DYN3; Short=Dynein protein 3 [Eremothecium gossypii ATCC 10895]AAS54158.1 AGL333Wp [Eremothecium gossypii ATCC 10895]AEY98484.1 FAGL333Wp [Eremothecium gossypii FDAG1]